MAWVFNPFTGKLDQAGSGGSGGSQVNSDWNASTGVAAILNKPSLFSGAYADLTGTPSTFAPSAHASSHASGGSDALTLASSQITGLASVATSGSAADLTGTLADARLSNNVALDNQNNNFTAGQSITAAANTSALTASYSVTGANTTPLLNLTGTWNTTGVAQGILLNITDTASNAASVLFDVQTAGTSRFKISKTGTVTAIAVYASNSVFGGTGSQISTTGLAVGSNASILWKSNANVELGTSDLFLTRDAANTLAQRNGTNAQTFRLYNTYTDASNYERGVFDWTTNSNSLTIGTQKAGTGTARRVRLNSAEGIDVYCSDTSRTFQFAVNQTISFNSFRGVWYSLTTDPTTTDLGSNTWAIYKNTTSGTVKLWVNDGGTMKSVALA